MVRKCSDILAVYPTGDNIVEAALSRFNGPPSHSQIMTASPPSNLHRPNELAKDVPLAKGDTRENSSPDNASSLIDPAKGGAFFGRNVTPQRARYLLDDPRSRGREVRGFGRDEPPTVGEGGGGLGIFEAAGARGKSNRTIRACNALEGDSPRLRSGLSSVGEEGLGEGSYVACRKRRDQVPARIA